MRWYKWLGVGAVLFIAGAVGLDYNVNIRENRKIASEVVDNIYGETITTVEAQEFLNRIGVRQQLIKGQHISLEGRWRGIEIYLEDPFNAKNPRERIGKLDKDELSKYY